MVKNSGSDTTLVLNIGKAALNAGKNDSAAVYFRKLRMQVLVAQRMGEPVMQLLNFLTSGLPCIIKMPKMKPT